MRVGKNIKLKVSVPLIKTLQDKKRYPQIFCCVNNCPHKNMVNLCKSSTHHGPNCPDYKCQDTENPIEKYVCWTDMSSYSILI